jgi:hypothetical protein
MTITPAIKGRITKAINTRKPAYSNPHSIPALVKAETMNVLTMYMPREQAKHVTRKYLASL